MRLFLIRHAHALKGLNDAKRPLSERGRQMAAHTASFFRHNGRLRPGQIWHSPLVRAAETAVAIGTGLEIDAPLVETDGLLPIDDPRIMARRLAQYPAVHDIALVGHEPHLSALATLLVTGRVRPPAFHCKKCSVMCLRDTEDEHGNSGLPRWRVAWHFSPEMLTDE